MKFGLAALGLVFCCASLAQANVFQYLDDDGNVHEVPDRQDVPLQYRDRAIEVDKPIELKTAPKEPERGVEVRLQDMLKLRQGGLPPANPGVQFSEPSQAGSGSSNNGDGGAAGAGVIQPRAAAGEQQNVDQAPSPSAAANVDLNKLKEALAKQKDPLMRKLVIASTAALATGYLWVALLAIVLFAFILTTRRLIALEDSIRKRRFWRWGFPILSLATVVLLHKWRYPKYLAVLQELLQTFGS